MASPTEVARILRRDIETLDFHDPHYEVCDFCTNVLYKVTRETEPRWLLTRLREVTFHNVRDYDNGLKAAIERAASRLDS